VGARTGALLPTGNVRDTADVPGFGEVEFTAVEIAGMAVFVTAEDFGLAGNESAVVLERRSDVLSALERLRHEVAVRVSLANSPEEAGLSWRRPLSCGPRAGFRRHGLRQRRMCA
jgi:2-methylaconitate cis-trans-isomerase PrpF